MLQIIADVSMFQTAGHAHGSVQTFDAWTAAFDQALVDAGAWVLAEGLESPGSAVTVRFENGSAPTSTDGPFADRDEQLVAFWIIEAKGVDEAVHWARKAPIAVGAIEVRPLRPGPPSTRRELPDGRFRNGVGDGLSPDSQQET